LHKNRGIRFYCFVTFAVNCLGMESKNRRTFIKIGITGGVAALVFVWNKLTLRYISNSKQTSKIFPFPKNRVITFYKDYIVVKREKTTVLSARCTHLGCMINKTENNRLVCPCHGSEFDLDGNAVKGPAYKSLEKIPSQIISGGSEIEIDI